MCGIAGFGPLDLTDRLHILFKLELRGRDGFGFVTEKRLAKTTETPTKYLETLPNPSMHFAGYTLLANTRAIPSTEFHIGAGKELKNQQPFSSEQFDVVFNGLIANDKDLIKKYDLKVESVVDTAILIPLFEKIGVVEGMRQLDGAFAIITYDKVHKKFYFGRNFMPLHYYQRFSNKDFNRKFAVASLKEMFPEELRDRVKEVPPYTCLTWDQYSQDQTIESFSLYRKKQNKKAMIIFSGGMDSVVTAYIYKHLGYDITLAHFTYGQAAQHTEQVVAKRLARSLNARLTIFDAAPLFKSYAKASKLLNQTEADVSNQSLDAESTLSYVPNRNATLAMFVAGLAEIEEYDTVAFGAQQMDAVYPDNTPDFVDKINQVLKVSLNWQTNIKFTAPLVHLMKHEIIQLAIDLDVPLEDVTSCYYPKLIEDPNDDCYICHNDSDTKQICSRMHPRLILVCEKCGPCQVRDATFKMLGVNDPQKGDKVEGKRSDKIRNDFINQYVLPFV